MFKHFFKGLLLLGCAISAIPGHADSANRTTSPSPDKFYRIISAATHFAPENGTAVEKMIYANDNNHIAWKNNDTADLSGIWRFTPGSEEGTFCMQNAKTLCYPSRQFSDNDPFVLVETKTDVTIDHIANTDNQVTISNGNNMHAGNWNGSIATNSGNIIVWNGGAGSASAWFIEPISAEELEALTDYYKSQKDEYLSLISHFSAANQAKFADAVATANNSASTAVELNDALTTLKYNSASVMYVVPVTKESMLQTGGQYVLGVVGTSTANWQPISPLCYKAETDGAHFGFVTKTDGKFTSDLIWTATVDNSGNHVCIMTTAEHNGSHKVMQFSQDFNGTQKAIKLNATANKVLAGLSDVATYMELVPMSCAGFPDELLFQFHTNWSLYKNHTQFAQIHAVKYNCDLGWYSRTFNETWNTDLDGHSDYSGLHRVYLVIDSENLQGAAEVIWNMLKEDECNDSESEQYSAQVNALPLPDISGFNDASTLIDDLTKEFKKQLFSLDGDFTAHVTPLTVIYSSGATSWNSLLTDTKGAFVKIITHGTSSETSGVAKNMKKLNETTFDFRNGTNHNSLYEFECFNPAFHIIGISFYASSPASGEYVTVDGEDILLTSTPQRIISTSPSIIFHGGNNQINVTDLTIKYRISHTPSVVPAESGWYSILYTHHTNASNATADSYVGKWAVNQERDVNQNNSHFYSLGVSDDLSAAPASNLVYITVNGTTRTVKSSNGHIVNVNCAADRSGSHNTDFTDLKSEPAPGTIRIGNYWDTFVHTVDGVQYQLIGKGSRAVNNRWAVFKENPEELYDIWTVQIIGAPDAQYIQNDVRVQCTNAANKGLSKVYNNGTFFITKGTTLSESDIVVDHEYTDNLNALLTVNNTNKIIKVEYLSNEAYLEAVYHSVVNKTFLPYGDICIFDNDKVNEVINNNINEINETAASDNAKLSDETIAALNALISTSKLNEGLKEIRLTAAGQLVQFRNYNHTNLYMSFAAVNSSTYRAAGETDNTSLNTLWNIEPASESDATFYLKNYGSGLWLQNHVRNNGNENNIAVADSNPAEWVIEAYYTGANNTPIIAFKDTQSASNEYLHQTTANNNRIVKWSSPVPPTSSSASAWTVTSAEDETIADEFSLGFSKSTDNGSQYIVLTHADGVSLHSAYHNDHHSIIIRKASLAQQVKSRTNEVAGNSENILITPDKLAYDEETRSVSSPINESGLLEDGSAYEALIPAGLVKIGDNKLSKATTALFRYSNNGTVDIEEIRTSDSVNIIYDLQGRRLAAPVKGINIINGKKTLIR